MSDSWDTDPAGEDEEQWREQVVNDAVGGEHVPTDEELDLDALEHEGLGDETSTEEIVPGTGPPTCVSPHRERVPTRVPRSTAVR